MLSALAVSIGNSHLEQVKRGWVESPILYMALIGRPGANKSHPLSFAFQPFIEDYRHNKEYQEQYAEYERTISMAKKERLEAGIYPRRNSTPTQQRDEPRQEVVRQEPSEESSLSAGLLDLATAPATDTEEEMLAKQYVKKKKKPQRKRGFRL